MRILKNLIFPIIALCFWIEVLTELNSREVKQLLSYNQCYKIDGEKVKVKKKEKYAFLLDNDKRISYNNPTWLWSRYPKVSCLNTRGIASVKTETNLTINLFMHYTDKFLP